MEQAFFAECGGVAIDASTGISTLARFGLLPRISTEEVKARGNADILTKLYTLHQRIWFGIQSVARIPRGLPLTLLETHTLAHVLCALLRFLIWLKKPYAVTAPVLAKILEFVTWDTFFVLGNDLSLLSYETMASGRYQKGLCLYGNSLRHPTH